MEIDCRFVYIMCGSEYLYTCKVTSASIKSSNEEIIGFKGVHKAKKTSADVEGIWFEDTTVHFIPRGIGKIFPNLKSFGIVNCNLMEISRDSFSGMENLSCVYIHKNKISSLPDNLFEGMTKLVEISIIFNKKLTKVNSAILARVFENGLTYVDFSYNACINNHFCPGYENSLGSVQELMEAIDRKDSGTLAKFRKKLLSGGKLDLFIKTEDKTYPFHKEVLAIHSAAFEKRMKKNPEANTMELLDFNPKSITSFIEYLYSGQIPKPKVAHEVYCIASSYQVDALMKESEIIAAQAVNKSNVVMVYKIGEALKSERMRIAAAQFLINLVDLGNNKEDSTKSDEFVTALVKAYEDYGNQYDVNEELDVEQLKAMTKAILKW
jgi:hypothetical protein